MGVKLGERKSDGWDGWARTIEHQGVTYRVGVGRGQPVMNFGRRGFQWYGWVMAHGRNLWSGRVPKSIGARGLLSKFLAEDQKKAAEVLERKGR